jgi:prophage maintenance system killer protein
MITLDVADLVVIASQVLGTSPEAALAQLDIAAAQAALDTSAGPTSSEPTSTVPAAAAAASAARLMHALLRHRLFPDCGEQVAVAAGLQFLALNGWQADLDPPGAALVVIEGLASGRLSPADAAAWLSPRLSPHSASSAPPAYSAPPDTEAPTPTLRSRATRLLRLTHAVSPVCQAGVYTPATGFLPFTGDAREVVVAARMEADRLGLGHPGPEQFLLSLVATARGPAAEALRRLGISPGSVREQVTQLAGQHRSQVPDDADIPLPMRVMPRAVGEAVSHGHDYIGTEHILLALFHAADDTAAQVLTRLGAGESEVRGALAPVLPRFGPGRPGHRRGRKPPTPADENRRLRLEIARLSDLLREHGIEPGIEPGETDRRSA